MAASATAAPTPLTRMTRMLSLSGKGAQQANLLATEMMTYFTPRFI